MLSAHQGVDSVAVVYQEGRLCYSEFDALVDLLCDELNLLNLSAGDRILTVMPNSLELLLCYYACLNLGLIIVPINDRMVRLEVQKIIDDAKPRCVIGAQDWVRSISSRASAFFLDTNTVTRITRQEKTALAWSQTEWPDDHPAIIYYTSGSTGVPKGVLYTHGTLRNNCRVYGGGLSITCNDHSVLCHCLSTNFVFAQLTYPVLSVGGTVQIVDFGSVEQSLSAIRTGATFLSLIPWFGFKLMRRAKRLYPGGLPNQLRSVEVGGDRVPQCFFEEFEQIFGIWPQEHFGMVETNTSTINPMSEFDRRVGSVGIPLPEVLIEIRDENGKRLPAGANGQIWVQTPAAMAGYWCDNEASQEVMDSGWIATGDTGCLDSDGYLWFVGRLKQIIICDGDNIQPCEIEKQLELHPEIDRACVVGLPHQSRGQTVAAALVANGNKANLNRSKLATFLEEKLSRIKMPESVCLLDELPETPLGKIDRKAVKRAFLY